MNLSRTEVLAEIEEKSADLEAFQKARDIVRQRVVAVQDSQSKLTPLPAWSGTDAVLGSLDLVCHAIERTLDELRDLLQTLPDEKPVFRVVGGTDVE